MKILLLAHRLPYPLESGQNLRLYQLARELAPRHELQLIAFGEERHARQLTTVFGKIWTLPIPPKPRAAVSVGRIVRAFDVDDILPRVPAMEHLVRHVTRSYRPDAVWVGGADMLIYAKCANPAPVVADVMDDGLLEHWRECLQARRPGALLWSLKHLVNYVRWERRYLRQAACCIFVSSLDATWARRALPGLRAFVVENGVDTAFFSPQGGEEEFPSLVFEGNQGFPPNADAARYFVREILPRVLKTFPDCRVRIVGRDPLPSTRALASERVEVTGRVEDVRPYLDTASVFVCPMRTGSGIKNKILQAWAMAKPVVATPIAVGGLRVRHGENITVAKNPAAFAGEVVHLLNDPRRRRELGEQSRETVLSRFTWQQQATALEAIVAGEVRHHASP